MNADRRDITADERDIAHDQADIRADRRDMWRDGRGIRADQADLRHDYAEQRAGSNEQADISRGKADITADRRDIQRDRADIRSDQQDIRQDRADLHADQRDLRSDSSTEERMARRGGGGQRADSERIGAGAAAHGGTLVASTRGAGTVQATNAAQRPHMAQASTHPQGLTPAGMANNAAEETKKPPATKVVHQAWWHWIW